MIRILNLVGARPQFIKYFPISEAIKKYNSLSGGKPAIEDILVHTGQHYDYQMSQVFFDEFGIKKPDHHLGVGSGSHGEQTAQIIDGVEKILKKIDPTIVLLYGDTNSTLGGALAATKLHIPIAHVEAGLRSFNKHMPEEINRILVDHASTFLFCPSKTAVKNLQVEGFANVEAGSANQHCETLKDTKQKSAKADINNPKVFNIGDVMHDVFLYSTKLSENSNILNLLDIQAKDYCLLTLHRAENTDHPEQFTRIVKFVNSAAKGKKVIFPMHPRTKVVYEKSDVKFSDNVHIREPLSYFDILNVLKNCNTVLTDSGGMQKEAYWSKVPCITLREETEWLETIESGWNVLYKQYQGKHDNREKDCLHYGKGDAAEKIVNILAENFN